MQQPHAVLTYDLHFTLSTMCIVPELRCIHLLTDQGILSPVHSPGEQAYQESYRLLVVVMNSC